MKSHRLSLLLLLLLVLTVCLSACTSSNGQNGKTTPPHSQTKKKAESSHPVSKPDDMTKVKSINWNLPSNGPYPTLKSQDHIWIDVSVNNQQVYIKIGQQTLYTMTASTGLNTKPDDSTPNGTFYIQQERGEWFYSPSYKEGAEYWVSWKNHGEFLFHSVPMNKDKQVIFSEAKKLGQKASHGCIRLTIPDAKWIYDNIKTGTKVVIRS